MNTYAIPATLVAEVFRLLDLMPASQSRRALNALEDCITKQNSGPVAMGGGGPGEPEDRNKA